MNEQINKAGKAVHNPVSTILLWLATSGMGVSLFSFANDVENQGVQTQTRQEVIIEQQKKIQTEVEDAQRRQQDIREILIRIETKLEKKP